MPLRNVPIKRKLILAILITASTVLLLTAVAFISLEIANFRREILRDVSTLGEVLAANSTASLAFQNEADAEEVLAALRAEPQILAAALYTEDGELFAAYPKNSPDPEPLSHSPGHVFTSDHLLVTQPVVQDNRILGYLHLTGDLAAVNQRIAVALAIAALILGLSLLIAFILSNLLQATISRPILALAGTARTISRTNDFSIRAAKEGNDEVGVLTEDFNRMLEHIDEQNNILRESEERFRMMVESVKDYAIVALDRDGKVASWNAGAERFKGYQSSDILGKSFAIFYPPEDVSAGKPAEELRIAAQEGRYEITAERLRKDGQKFWAQVTLAPVRNPEGELIGFTQVTRDITERKQAEEQILQLNAELEQRVRARTSQLEEANKQLESFSYSVSHDLRAPLRHIQGYAEMLAEEIEGKLSPEADRFLRTIKNSSVEMGQLIDDLLAFSRMGRTELNLKPISPNELIDETIAALELSTKDRNIEWTIHPLPKIVGDAPTLKQVFANLIGNAVKYSRQRDPAQIEIGQSGEKDGRPILFVRDNGAGFDMRYAKNLFGVFQRLHRSDEFEGTGIGLATVRRIIARHGGEIWAEAAVNQGATFYFTLDPAPEPKENSSS